MEIGTTVVAEITLHRIVYHSGDSAYRHEEHYFSRASALVGSVLRGVEQEPQEVEAFKLSNGDHIMNPRALEMGTEPTQEEIARVKTLVLKNISPATKLLLSEQ